MVNYIGLDFETYGEVNLPKYGLDRYLDHPSFCPLIASISIPGSKSVTYDFVYGGKAVETAFMQEVGRHYTAGNNIVAHNVGFERGVLRKMGATRSMLDSMYDSAVVARAQGAASALEAAAPQLLSIQKLELGKDLIKKFSIPNEWNGHKAPTAALIDGDIGGAKIDWKFFKDYCEVDAGTSLGIVEKYKNGFSMAVEQRNELATDEMNRKGWFVDMALVQEMQYRYEANVQAAMETFSQNVDAELNLNSTVQLKKWCAERGIKATSFDSDHVTILLGKLERGIAKGVRDPSKLTGYMEVKAMLETKQILGGSSLSKLQKIVELTNPNDHRLRGQYLHLGAGQTYRATGKGVQMQNLKRLGPDQIDEMEDLYDPSTEASNELLANNLRQVFRAEEDAGLLLVGDFSSVESRGLAYLAGEEWKLDAYRKGQDIYKVLASRFSGTPYDQVDKQARMEGKYSELSCGYQAGGQAVKDFMHRLGFEVDLDGANQRVFQWREANPKIVELWATLDLLLHKAVDTKASASVELAHDLQVDARVEASPMSLQNLHPGVFSLRIVLRHAQQGVIMERVFHGIYKRGKQICLYKPTDRKTGDLWKNHYRHPKTGEIVFYSIYGGKLSGVLTQSLCREFFVFSLNAIYRKVKGYDNLKLVGQFHDEIVVEWSPARSAGLNMALQHTLEMMDKAMSTPMPGFGAFPLTAEIKQDHRYTK